jgi:hypothetical protein
MHVVDRCAFKICIMYWHYKARSILELSSHLCISFVSHVCATLFTMSSFIWLPENIWCSQSMRHLTKRILHSCHCPLGPISCLTLQLIFVFFHFFEKPEFHVITWQKTRIIRSVFVYIISELRWAECVGSTCLAGKAATYFEFIVIWSIMAMKSL